METYIDTATQATIYTLIFWFIDLYNWFIYAYK